MKIKDSFTNKEQEIIGKKIKIYLCGPTSYDDVHIGNLRPVIIFDVLTRILKLDHEVDYVHNITDIDDKIIQRAQETDQEELFLSSYYANRYLNILKRLNIDLPTYIPKVSDNIDLILKFIDNLIKSDKAYVVKNNVYFSIKKWDKYEEINNFFFDKLKKGNLSDDDKKISYDFALWKDTKDQGIKFSSPWGLGRPGWHTECVSLINYYFKGETIDLHGGGIDLKFPHHANERAQFESLYNKPLAKTWLHVGYVNFNEKKMSKSLGNIFKAEDFIEQYSQNLLKILLIGNHYTKPVNVNENSIENASKQLQKIKNIIIKSLLQKGVTENDFIREEDQDFLKIVNNDLDLPNGITHINNQIKILNKEFSKEIFQKMLFNLSILGIKIKINFDLMKKNNKDYSKIKQEELLFI